MNYPLFLRFPMLAEYMHGDVSIYVTECGEDYMVCRADDTDYQWFSTHEPLDLEAGITLALSAYTGSTVPQNQIGFI